MNMEQAQPIKNFKKLIVLEDIRLYIIMVAICCTFTCIQVMYIWTQ